MVRDAYVQLRDEIVARLATCTLEMQHVPKTMASDRSTIQHLRYANQSQPRTHQRLGEPPINRDGLSSSKERHAKLIFVNRNAKNVTSETLPKTKHLTV